MNSEKELQSDQKNLFGFFIKNFKLKSIASKIDKILFTYFLIIKVKTL